jgi:REP element-mobilizing transposase RayT
MPNHVHLLVKPRESHGLAEIVKGWKAFTARAINALYGTKGRVWQVEYWDRYIRDAGHYDSVVAYIHENPVKAGLVATAGDWEWSSAAGGDTCAPGG